MAPLSASEPRTHGVRPIDEVLESATGPRPGMVDLREATASAVRPRQSTAVDSGPSFAAALDAARTAGGAYGITFAAVRDGSLLWEGASGRGRDGATTLTSTSPLVIGSVTKTFVAAAVLQLVDEGRIELTDPVRRHLPQLRQLSREITVAQLLDHTSGLADLFNDTTRRGLEDEPGRSWTADEVLGSLHAPWYEPGEGWAYANTNYYLLALLVERVTGASLADELDRRFLDPLDLDRTAVLGSAAGSPLEAAWTSIFWGSGAMSSSAADLARWGDALYNGDVLASRTRAAMLTVNGHEYGLGVQRIEVGELVGYGHTGLLNTYTTLLLHVPAERTTVALLVNRSHVDLGGMLSASPAEGPSLLELAFGN